MKKILMIVALLFNLHASSDYDKDIIVLEQSRDDKVKIVFSELMQNYEEEDSHAFFELISEERFIQDYMTFSEAIDEDFRKYEIINVDKWIDKITSDGVKRYLYVKWEKRYETNSGNREILQKGYSRFLFDEINGQYKLIELAGNNLWGGSLIDWKEEVGTIPHQEPEEKIVIDKDKGTEVIVKDDPEEDPKLPDLVIRKVKCLSPVSSNRITFANEGEGSAVPTEKYIYIHSSTGEEIQASSSTLLAGAVKTINISDDEICANGGSYTIDKDNQIKEEDEDNNDIDVEERGLPDLTINIICPSGFGGAMPIEITITNIGETATTTGKIYYDGSAVLSAQEYNGNLNPGQSIVENKTGDCYNGNTLTVDQDDFIEEEDEGNNTSTLSGL